MSKSKAKALNLEADKQQLWRQRHTAEHLLHQAAKELFPQIHLVMGPAIDEGFYFDFDPNGEKVSEHDFVRLEARMQELIKLDLPMIEEVISVQEARKLFQGNPYKQEWLDEIEQDDETVTVYWTGEPGGANSMVDLCAGPHVESTGQVGVVKLLSVAGAYWHGDENNQMLTRIYGTAFSKQDELDEFLHLRAEAIARDHKKLGRELDLFTFSELVGPGLPLWTPKGTLLRNTLDEFVWQLRQERGYSRVQIPHITKKELFETSGHWSKFADELFRINTREGHEFAMKPMNCPFHTQIYNSRQRSYRDLPQRYAETTMVYRDEQTGELGGLSRVRSITQDDAHVFCRENQLNEEALKIWEIIELFYKACGFPELRVRLSLHDPENFDNYLGTKQAWKHAEDQLRSIIRSKGIEVSEAAGEAAFYGPKIDFMTDDALGREWQVATIQVDRNMPERFDLWCINEQGEKERPVMLHAAIMGSIERFVSILIEHHAGAFPLWLAPVQVKLLPIADRHLEYVTQVRVSLESVGIRVEVDDRGERLPAKIRDAQVEKIPLMVVIGDKEVESNQVALRLRAGGKQQVLGLDECVEQVKLAVEEKREVG